MFSGITKKDLLLSFLGGLVLAFGIYNIHSLSGVTEGGILGLNLLLQHHFGISPAVSSPVLNIACYALGAKMLGKRFIPVSLLSVAGFSAVYALCERFPVVWPGLAELPAVAAVLGGIFVGVGCGLCVRAGGAPTGDDAVAMALSRRLKVKIERVYLISDLTVLGLSLTYIPLGRIVWSLVTVLISGRIIGLVQRYGAEK